MSQQLGPTYLLSLLVVIGSAIAFYRVEKPTPSSPRPADEPQLRARPEPVAGAPRPANEPIRARLVAETRTPPPRFEPKPAVSVEPRRAPVATPASRLAPRSPSVARGAFARTEEGETLEAVALRIYGTSEKAEALWKANRDQLPNPDSALTAGMLLRTP